MELYFDTLSKDENENVVRFITPKPFAKDWRKHAHLNALVPFFTVIGHFGAIASAVIDRVRISDVVDCHGTANDSISTARDSVSTMIRPRDMVRAHKLDIVHEFIKNGGGSCVQTISITEDRKVGRNPRFILEDFARMCPNITSMNITSDGGDWLEIFGHKLTSLSLGYYAPMHTLSDKCNSLKELTLYGDASYGNHICWKKLGATLEVISASLPKWRNRWDICEIGQYCRKLRRIQLDVIEEDTAELAEILPTYKKQLEYAVVSGMNENQLVSIARSCPNAKFGLNVYSYPQLLSSLKVLGDQLEVINVDAQNSVQPSELCTAWNSCGALKHIQYTTPELSHIYNLFAKPKPCLRSIVIDLSDDPYIQNTIDMIADQTGYLEKIVLNWRTSNPPCSTRDTKGCVGDNGSNLFKRLAQKNSASLSNAIISLHSGCDSVVPVSTANAMFRTFAELPNIEQVVLYGIDENEFLEGDNPLEDARKLGIDVEVGYYPELIHDTKTTGLRWMLRN